MSMEYDSTTYLVQKLVQSKIIWMEKWWKKYNFGNA